MFAVFSGMKNLWKCKKLHIDHCVFRLHYKVSVILLLGFCALVGSKQYAGEPIKCASGIVEITSVVEIYCFITSTYTVKTALDKTPLDGAPHPGVYPSEDKKEYHYHVYYQWIGFLLFIQAMLFYLPHWLWKSLEGGQLVRLLGKDMKDLPSDERFKYKSFIVDYIRSRWCKEKQYCLKYFFCEFLCLINVIGQFFMIDKVFDGEYLSFGIEVIRHFLNESASGPSPFDRIFPRVTSCTYNFFGVGGKVNEASVLCVLAVNVINEKIYLFLWFWIVSLIILTVIAMTYKLFVFSVPSLRLALLRANFRNVRGEDFRFVVENGNIGDYLFIYLLGQNMDQLSFSDVVTELVAKLQTQVK